MYAVYLLNEMFICLQCVINGMYVYCSFLNVQLEYIVAGLGRLDNGDGVGVGMDSCVLPTRHHGYYLVQTTDLYPYNFYQ